jgi:predicted nucleotidyltransferase component of viral defense system
VIPAANVTAWSLNTPWATPEQVEQDLLLSRAICEIARHPYLGEELTFRGGTAFHKLHLPAPLRYSEDLDYVRSTSGGIRTLTGALSEVGQTLGFEVSTRISAHPKVYWRTTAASGAPLRLKIEVNTHERSPALPLTTVTYSVDSPWWSGRAEIKTFQPAELVSTKLRALYQRNKGRDLFDLWLALTELRLPPEDILMAFEPYRPESYTSADAIANLTAKLRRADFRKDLDPLLRTWPVSYDVETAGALVVTQLLTRIR